MTEIKHDDSQVADALDQRFVDLIAKNKLKIPPYPATAMRLGELISTDNYTLRELSKLTERDSVLTAAVLRTANSPMYMAARPITSLDAAVGRIGTDGLVRIALAAGLGAHTSKPGTMLTLRSLVWRRALLAGELCRAVAPRRGLKGDEAFVCGLLHDFGKVVALACLEEIMAGKNTGVSFSYARCAQVVEAYHLELGLVMATKWNLSELVAEVVSEHHRPIGSAGKMTQLVVISDQILDLADCMPRVTADDMGTIPYLSGAEECNAIADTLQDLPPLVHAFGSMSVDADKSGGAKRRKTKEEPIVKPERSYVGAFPADFQVVSSSDQGSKQFHADAVTETSVRMTGAEPLLEQIVVPLKLHCAPAPLEIWGTVSACDADESGFRLEVKPLGLDARQAHSWQALVAAAQK